MNRGICALVLALLFMGGCAPAAREEAATVSPFPTCCAPTENPTATRTSLPLATRTITPTATRCLVSTPVPPLVAHTWTQSEPLVSYVNGPGTFGNNGLDRVLPVQFLLLPSGDLYLRRWNDTRRADELLTATLSRQEICQLLNSIDQAGFFDYDPSKYIPLGPTDFGGTLISVHAWREKSVGLYALSYNVDAQEKHYGYACDTCFGPGFPAVRDTYRLLDQYQPPVTLQPMELKRLGVWLDRPGAPIGSRDSAAVEWPLNSHPLAAVAPVEFQRYWNPSAPNMILIGADAIEAYDALGRSFRWRTPVREGDKVFQVFARPLLPNEFNTSPLPRVSLSCSPSDGWHRAP